MYSIYMYMYTYVYIVHDAASIRKKKKDVLVGFLFSIVHLYCVCNIPVMFYYKFCYVLYYLMEKRNIITPYNMST